MRDITMQKSAALSQLPAMFQQALSHHRNGQLVLAQRIYEKILKVQPRHFDALHLSGAIAVQTGNPRRALEFFDRAIAVKTDYPDAYYNRALALAQLGRASAALMNYEKAIELNGDYFEAHYNRGNLLVTLNQFEAACTSYEKAIAVKPDHAEVHLNRGNVLRELQQFGAALMSYDRAHAVDPVHPDILVNRGHVLVDLKQYEAAIASYDRALALNPHIKWLWGQRRQVKMQICDWGGFERDIGEICTRIARSEAACSPFALLALSESPDLQRKAAEIWVREQCPASSMLPAIRRGAKREKIRLGYFSADYRNHAISILAANLFETHDRSRFEVIAFSFGPDTKDEMRKRLETAFDRFIDVGGQSDRDVALLARTMELDIAIDLGGFTKLNRARIFAMRAAAIQVSYLGYLGTMGSSYMDYLIADRWTVPIVDQEHYSEKIIYLPCYQVNDARRGMPETLFPRNELGLPAEGFVFCCFNDNYKISPAIFDSWMRVLTKAEGSVLLLYASHDSAKRNLQQEAGKRGVDANRLVFGEKLPYSDYLARFRSADLFLDTLPYNAGTTASDALWAGLPVLTCIGQSFASKVAASLLGTLGLSELITSTLEEYECRAVELARDPQRLARIKRDLAQKRSTAPLFNTPLFTKNLETAYGMIYERYHAGLAPDQIDVSNSLP